MALLAVAAATIFVSTIVTNSNLTGAEITEDSRLTEQEALAQRAANSGLELALSQVHRDFDGWRSVLNSAGGAGAAFEATAAGPTAGPIVVAATGTVDTTSFDVYRMMARLASLPAALTIDAAVTDVTLTGTDWLISGRDTPLFSEPTHTEGYGLAGTRVPAVWAGSADTETAFQDALTNSTRDQVRGVNDNADIVQSLSGDLSVLVAEAKSSVTNDYAQPQTFSNASFGSLGSPVIVRVQGDASFAGTSTGYGMLIVEGDLQVRDTFEWHGLLVVEGEDEMKVDLGGEATIYGAVYVDHESTQAPACVDAADQQRQALAAVAPLASFPARSGRGTQTRTIAWPGYPSVEVQTQLSKSGGRYRQAEVGGTTLQGAAQDATVGGVSTGNSDINNPDYTGPRDLQLLSVHPGLASNWTQSDVRFTFDAAMTQPFYLHVFDLDQVSMTIKAYDENGDRVSTASWSLSNSMDVLLTSGQADDVVYEWDAQAGSIRPSQYGDTEMIAGQLLVSNFAEVREIRVEMRNATRNRGELVYLALSTEPLADTNVRICPPEGGAPGGPAQAAPPVHIGDTQTPQYAGWASDDHTGQLMYYIVEDGQTTQHIEGSFAGIEEPGNTDIVDAEAMTFADDGTLYFINDGESHPSGDANQRNALYRVAPSQFDGNPNTPVQVHRVGGVRQTQTSNEVMGLLFQDDVLYGLSLSSDRIYRMNTSTGEAVTYRTFSDQGRSWGGLTRGIDGTVYMLGNRSGQSPELWRFDNFPDGTPTRLVTLSGVGFSEAMSAHPDGSLYILEGGSQGGDRVVRVNPKDGTFTTQALSHEDVQAFAFYFQGEAQALGVDIVAPLAGLAKKTGIGTHTHAVSWSGQPDLTITSQLKKLSGYYLMWAEVGGTTLAGMAQEADRDEVNLGYVDINNPDYTGPENLQLFRVGPGASAASSGGRTEADVRIAFSEAFTQPFHLHVMDLDWGPMTIEAYDADGRKISTASWTLSKTTDLLLEDGEAESVTYQWDADQGRLVPTSFRDSEVIAGQLTINNYEDVREIRMRHWSESTWIEYFSDFVMIGISVEPLYEQVEKPLHFTMANDAEIYYSSEALGQLAALLPSLEGTSRIVEYDQFGMDLRAVFEHAQDQGGGSVAGAPTPRQEDENRVLVCIDGLERKVSSLGLSTYLARGATEGACPRVTGETGLPSNPNTVIDICYQERSKRIRAGDADYWLGLGARLGACSAPPQERAGVVPTLGGGDNDDDDDDDDDDQDDDDDDDRDDDDDD
ncbi:MAG: hypothetical protein AAGF99_03120 [Bacteroidota bacterium]